MRSLKAVAVPFIILAVLFDNFARRRGWKSGTRYSTWYWRIWWRIGYGGVYQFGWLYKRRGLRARDVLLPWLQVWKALR